MHSPTCHSPTPQKGAVAWRDTRIIRHSGPHTPQEPRRGQRQSKTEQDTDEQGSHHIIFKVPSRVVGRSKSRYWSRLPYLASFKFFSLLCTQRLCKPCIRKFFLQVVWSLPQLSNLLRRLSQKPPHLQRHKTNLLDVHSTTSSSLAPTFYAYLK